MSTDNLALVDNIRTGHRTAHRGRRIILFAVLLLFVLALIYAASVGIVANRVVGDVHALQGLLERDPAARLRPDTLQRADETLGQTIQDFQNLHAIARPLLAAAPYFAWVPQYGGDIANAPALVDLGEQVLAAGRESLTLARRMLSAVDSENTARGSIANSMVRASGAELPAILQARAKVVGILPVRSRIDEFRLSPTLRTYLARLDQALPLWQAGLDMLAVAPQMLGGERPKVYLLVAQNSDELRATGGFISGVAELKVDQGEISVGEFMDSYAIDDLSKLHPTPPEPLRKYMHAGQWFLRDANWSPDFPTAARTMENLYRIDRGVTVDGVIAVDLQAVPVLLEAIGPLTIDNERVDPQNALTKIFAAWEVGVRQDALWTQRKAFVGKLLRAMIERLRSGGMDQTKLAQGLYGLILSRDVLVYLNDRERVDQTALPWGGALDTTSPNALMLVDSNLGFNKVSSNITRQASYALEIGRSGDVQAALTITYTNRSPASQARCILEPSYPDTYAEYQQGCYWNYVRIAVPAGSQLLGAAGLADMAEDRAFAGRAIFGGYLVVPRGETRVVSFTYRLPSVLQEAPYHILLEKQPGALPLPVRVQVSLPAGWTAMTATPAVSQTGNEIELSALLDRNREIELAFQH